MAFGFWRPALRSLSLVGLWLLMLPALLWIYIYADFFVMQPRRFQTELFGQPIAAPWALRAAKNDCCIIPLGDGAMQFTYQLTPDVAKRLATECLRTETAGGMTLPVSPGTCLVRSKPFGRDGMKGGIRATVKGEMLELDVDWV